MGGIIHQDGPNESLYMNFYSIKAKGIQQSVVPFALLFLSKSFFGIILNPSTGMILYLLLTIMIVVVLAAIIASAHTRHKAALAAQCLKSMEKRYEQFLEDNLSEELWVEGIFITSAERLAKDALLVLQKDILALTQLTEGSYPYSKVEIPYTAQYFPNVAALAEEQLYQSRYSRTQQVYTTPPLERFSTALLEAIEADLQQRLTRKSP